ncbi:MAG: restriction endonuclease subunit S [Planctomycetota bacterium]|nr:restriction endonuclease subunit S [Planctomycetota bacterium]
MDFNESERVKFSLKSNDLLVCEGGEVGRTAIWQEELSNCYFQKAIHCLRPKDAAIIDPLYTFRFMQFAAGRNLFARLTSKTSIAHLTKEKLSLVKIPLPPLAEQKRIAAILDKADGIRRKKQEILRLTDELLKSTFLEMFGDPGSFESKQLQDLASKTKYSLSSGPFGSSLTSKHYVSKGVLVLRGLNVSGGELSLDNCKFVSESKAEELARSTVRTNDVVIVAVGSSGQAFHIPDNFPRAVLSQNFNKITPDESQVHPVYLAWALNSPIVQREFFRNITDTVRTFLSLTKIKRVNIPVPPLELQLRFACIVEHVKHQKTQMRAHHEKIENLFNSLVQKAFRGELSNPESAKKQLKLFKEKAKA